MKLGEGNEQNIENRKTYRGKDEEGIKKGSNKEFGSK